MRIVLVKDVWSISLCECNGEIQSYGTGTVLLHYAKNSNKWITFFGDTEIILITHIL